MGNTIKYLAFGAFLGAAFASPLPANAMKASSMDAAPAKLVSYGDLNLDSETGARTLYARLRAASREVCVGYEGSASMEQRMAGAQCYSAALTASVAHVNSPALSSLYSRAQIR
jgi:UrcA family protein